MELAAARVGTLSVKQICERLEDTLGLLTGGGRTRTPRQRTLRGALDWSYDLLGEQEQVLFRRLSVFAGGWTIEAAETVGQGGGVEAGAVLDLLSGLVDKSLVVTATTDKGALRYGMLEPIRQYAREKLDDIRQARETLRRHATFFLALAEEADPKVEGAQQAPWLDRLETEHDNIRVAMSWSLEHSGDAELGLRMGAALGEFWYLRGYLDQGRRWLEEALAKPSPVSTEARARALHRVSWLAFVQGDLGRAEGASEEGLELEGVKPSHTGGGDRTAADLQRVLGLAMSARGEAERAIELFEEGLTLSRAAGSLRGAAVSLLCLGIEWRGRSNFGRATELLEEALTLCRRAGDPALIASILTHLGYAFLLQGDLERSTVINEEAAAMLREQEHRAYLADVLQNLGWTALLRGDPERAKVVYAESLGLWREVGGKLGAAETLGGVACANVARGEVERAARLFGAMESLREGMGSQQEPSESRLQEPYLVAARSRLEEVAWHTAWTEGRAMGMEEAIEYASSEEVPAAAAPLTPVQHRTHKKLPTLTRREEEVANLVARGFTNRRIAEELSISEHTVESHVAKILKKLGCDSRTRIAAWATRQRLHTAPAD